MQGSSVLFVVKCEPFKVIKAKVAEQDYMLQFLKKLKLSKFETH